MHIFSFCSCYLAYNTYQFSFIYWLVHSFIWSSLELFVLEISKYWQPRAFYFAIFEIQKKGKKYYTQKCHLLWDPCFFLFLNKISLYTNRKRRNMYCRLRKNREKKQRNISHFNCTKNIVFFLCINCFIYTLLLLRRFNKKKSVQCINFACVMIWITRT